MQTWSAQQNQIFSEFKSGRQHVVVRARAGTGKTTTIIEGISHAPENKICLVAFNKKIAEELKTRLKNPRAEAKTLHSVGYSSILKAKPGTKVDVDRFNRISEKIIPEKFKFVGRPFVRKLAALAKNHGEVLDVDGLIDMQYDNDIDPDEDDSVSPAQVAIWTKLVLDASKVLDGTVDFDDMIYIPVVNNLIRPMFDLVVVDECQDMNPAQIFIAEKMIKKTGRLVVVGDDRQAIYGFRGADSKSIDRLKKKFNAKELGLTTTYRCPKRVVELAQKIVPDFNHGPMVKDGEVNQIPFEKLLSLTNPGDFVLSRKNAPLITTFLKFLRAKKKALIEGKDIGKNLLSLVKKLKAFDIPDLQKRLSRWEEKEISRLLSSGRESAESKVELVRDKTESLLALLGEVDSVKGLEKMIEDLFVDSEKNRKDYVILSSVHKSKGLESDNVFILSDTLYPGGRKNEEEANIEYVAITRTKKRLFLVEGLP